MMFSLGIIASNIGAAFIALLYSWPVNGEKYPYGETFSGDATYYGYTTQGNCAIREPIPHMYDGMIPVALNAPQYGDSLLCGACIEGTSNGDGGGRDPVPSTFKAYVTDQCPECSWGDLDFSMSGDGRWDIEWEFVECPASDEQPTFMFEGSNPWYWKIQPRGTATPVAELYVNRKYAERTDDNFFIVTDGGPFYGEQEVETKTVSGSDKKTMVSLTDHE